MQTTIRLRLSEINASFLEKLRTALGQLADSQDPEVDIILKDVPYNLEFIKMIKGSVEEMETGKTHVFTMESLRDFVQAK